MAKKSCYRFIDQAPVKNGRKRLAFNITRKTAFQHL